MQDQIAFAPLWWFSSGYVLGLAGAGAVVFRTAVLKLMEKMNAKFANSLLIVHLIPVFLGIEYIVHAAMTGCRPDDPLSILPLWGVLGFALSMTMVVLSMKKLQWGIQ